MAWRIRFSLSFRSVTSFLGKLESGIYLILGEQMEAIVNEGGTGLLSRLARNIAEY